MDTQLLRITDPVVKYAPKENLFAFFRNFANSPAAEVVEEDGLVRWHTQVPHPWFNGVLCRNRPGPDESATIRGTCGYFLSKGVGAITWWLAPGLEAEAWGEPLSQQGFHYDHNTPGMAIDLAEVSPLNLPDGLAIEPVRTPESLKTWISTFIRGYGLPDGIAESYYNLVLDLGYELPMRNYTGFLHGRAVAASTLFLGAGVAGVYSVATLPEARGRGLGTALTMLPLLEAREMGYQVGVLQSSDMGYPIYQKIGFRTTCQIDSYYKALT
jgi:ribosomal protein S18 acetylase RimI-like enzyme